MVDCGIQGGKRDLFRCMRKLKLDSSAARVATLTSHIMNKIQSAVRVMRRPIPAVPRC
jgi:hypothetical protein